jgi:hypothetical protein
MSEAKKKFSPLGQFSGRLVRYFLLGTVAILLMSQFRTASAQNPTAPVPTKITEVKPAIVQPGGMLTLVFDKAVTTQSVQVGTAQAAYDTGATSRLVVTLPSDVPMGRQNVSVRVLGEAEPITAVVTVAPVVLGLQANKDTNVVKLSGVVVGGGEFMVKLSDKIPSAIRQNLVVRLVPLVDTSLASGQPAATQSTADVKPCEEGEKLSVTFPEEDYLLVQVPEKPSNQPTYALRICAGDTVLQKDVRLHVQNIYVLYLRASIVTFLLIVLIYLLYRVSRWVYKKKDQSEGKQQQAYNFLSMLLLEPENQTYSLSRAQFVSWLFVIVWCYLFLYYVHGYVGLDWSYPPLGNSVYAFVISLGTLLAAQVTNRTQGVKGAGEEHPSVADLVVHGGVLALDRVQQVVWTLITLGMFVRITVSTFETAKALPDIPNELLMLMGLSSAGYLGGKIVRGAGPVIDQVTAREGSLILNIKGKHLSKDAFVWIDGTQVTSGINVAVTDPDDPTKFATELELTLDMSMADWWAQEHAITVVNNDAQRADWRTTAQIVEVTAGEPANGRVTLTVKSAYARKDATIVVKDTSAVSKQDTTDPNLFTVVGVPADWVNSPHDVIIKSGDRESTFKYTPTTTTGGQGADATGGQGADATGGQGAGQQGAADDQGEGQQGAGTGASEADANQKSDTEEQGTP